MGALSFSIFMIGLPLANNIIGKTSLKELIAETLTAKQMIQGEGLTGSANKCLWTYSGRT